MSTQEAEEVVPALEDASEATPSMMRLESRKKKFTMKARTCPASRRSLDSFRAYLYWLECIECIDNLDVCCWKFTSVVL